MARDKAKTEDVAVNVMKVEYGKMRVRLLGTSPLLMNAMSAKVKGGLLCPRAGKMTAADKAAKEKHNPLVEFVDSTYRFRGDDEPTRLYMPAVAFKAAIRDVALDMPTVKKAVIGRLTYVPGESIAIYGIPELKMDVVRLQDMSRTPDIRTRAILKRWACELTVVFTKPIIREQMAADLVAAAGIMRGVGDGRQEKGLMNNGQWEMVGADSKEWAAIVKAGGRGAQDKALEEPVCYDQETEELLAYWQAEHARRQLKTA